MSTDNEDAVAEWQTRWNHGSSIYKKWSRWENITKEQFDYCKREGTVSNSLCKEGDRELRVLYTTPPAASLDSTAAHAAQAERIDQLEKGLRLSAEDHDDTAHIISNSAPKDNVLRSIALKAKFARAFLSGQPVQQPGDVPNGGMRASVFARDAALLAAEDICKEENKLYPSPGARRCADAIHALREPNLKGKPQ